MPVCMACVYFRNSPSGPDHPSRFILSCPITATRPMCANCLRPVKDVNVGSSRHSWWDPSDVRTWPSAINAGRRSIRRSLHIDLCGPMHYIYSLRGPACAQCVGVLVRVFVGDGEISSGSDVTECDRVGSPLGRGQRFRFMRLLFGAVRSTDRLFNFNNIISNPLPLFVFFLLFLLIVCLFFFPFYLLHRPQLSFVSFASVV